MIDNFMPYSAYLILHRALPMIDGFKPSQRRVLYTMYKNNYINTKPYVKSNSIAGDVMKIHPHGSTYETLVRMTEGNEAFGVPFIDSKGSFGKIYSRDSKEASERYTEARLNKLAVEMFAGIDKDAVNMSDTYDGQSKEPEVLPVSYPTILTNGVSGLAVGMATEIPPFNFHEVINYTIALVNGQSDDILNYIPAPDFPIDNEIVYDTNEMKGIMETGRGSFKLRAKYVIEDNMIHFIHVPHTTKYEIIIGQITDLVKDGKLKEVTDIHDVYGMNSTGIQVEAKKGTNMERLVAKLFQLTKLEDTFPVNLNIVLDNTPQVLGVTQVIKEWIKFRKETVKRITNFQLKENEFQLEKLTGLTKVIDILDEVIALIRNTESSKISAALQERFGLTEVQASYIEDMQLRNLAKDYILKRLENIEKLKSQNEALHAILNDETTLNRFIAERLERLNKEYQFPRRTGFVSKEEVVKTQSELKGKISEVEDYNLKMFITKDMYLKKLPLTSMRGKFTNRLKEDDTFTFEEEMTNLGEVIVFTNKYNIYKKRISEIEDTKPSELGGYIPSMFDYEKGEQPLFTIPLRKEFDQIAVLGFSDGSVAKIDVKAYYTKQNRQVLKNGYADGKELIYVSLENESVHLKSVSENGYAVVRDLQQIKPKMSRSSEGNRFMMLNEDDKVKEYVLASDEDVEKYLTKTASKGKKVK